MNTERLPVPPIDREAVEAARARLRQQIKEAPPATDPLTREMQQNIADGLRGRDLLQVDVYREHFAAHADEAVQRLRRVREDFDEQTRGRSAD